MHYPMRYALRGPPILGLGRPGLIKNDSCYNCPTLDYSSSSTFKPCGTPHKEYEIHDHPMRNHSLY